MDLDVDHGFIWSGDGGGAAHHQPADTQALRFPTILTLRKSPFDLPSIQALYNFWSQKTLFEDTAFTTPVSGDGSAVAGVRDLSGRGNHLTQATAGARPTFKQGQVDGLHVARFTTDDYLIGNGLAATFTGNDAPWTVFTVVQKASNVANDSLWCAGNSGDDNEYQHTRTNGTPNYVVFRAGGPGDTANGAGGTPDTSVHVIEEVFSGTTHTLMVDGSAVLDDIPLDVGEMTVDQFALGARFRTTVDLFLEGDLLHFSAFAGVLSPGRREDIRGELLSWIGA